jgi:tRNA (guanosine-2'-O-)-methyltransferase
MSPERFKRINELLDKRQADLTVCLEMVHKNNNLAAIVRTADAVGINTIHTIWPEKKIRIAKGTATGSQKWVDVKTHHSTSDAIKHLKSNGMQIVVTNLSESSLDYRAVDYTKPTAVFMGQEKHGITEEALKHADVQMMIPMVGMVQSLNVSVATAVILYEAQRQREQAGLYKQPIIDDSIRQQILFEGGHPIFAKICQLKNIPYPKMNHQGQIDASDEWWHAIRQS